MIKPHRGRHRNKRIDPHEVAAAVVTRTGYEEGGEEEDLEGRDSQKQQQRYYPASRRRLHNSLLMVVITVILALFQIQMANCNLPPVFTQDMNNEAFSESTPVGTVVYKLEGYDPESGNVTFGLIDSGNFMVDPQTGEVRIVKALDRESEDTLQFLVSIKDRVNASGDSENDNVVQVPITVIVLDDNDNPPEFQNVPYEVDVLEDAPMGTTVFDKIMVTDKDSVGENLDIVCSAQPQNPDACDIFKLVLLRSDQNILKAALVLNGKLDYNDKMIYHIRLNATDSVHEQTTDVEIRVKDVQNTPPVFLGSLAAVIDEDSQIGTLVMTVQARDGDKGQPRRISYELITNPMDYFLLDAQTGELRTGKPLDKEALPDATGLITLVVKAHEIVDEQPSNDESTSATTQVSITIRDVNDSPPMFNQREYFATLNENTPIGTPLPLDISVRDPDVGQNSIFALRLSDVSGVFDVEPKMVTGSSQITITVAKGALDYENPNQRKFIVLIIAEETNTNPKLSSTATLTVSIVDTNDNRPQFDHDSYSSTVSELAAPGQLVTTITARDVDGGDFGERGLRYSIFGKGSELFHVDAERGAITVAPCDADEAAINHRVVRQVNGEEEEQLPTGRVNVTHNSQFGIVHIPDSNTDRPDYVTYQVGESSDYDLYSSHETTVSLVSATEATPHAIENILPTRGRAPCLDFENQPVYYLSFRATDDLGRGQSSVVSLRIQVTDENDSPPQCESPLYRASVDEGAKYFDPPLIVKTRDADSVSDVVYSVIAPEHIRKMFRIDKRTGQLSISSESTLDVNHLKSEHVSFSVEANDGQFSALCRINITIRDVNNHSPQFKRSHFVSTIAEDLPIGTIVDRVEASDLDKGENAEVVYRFQQGSFDDFQINNRTGDIVLTRKLDFDRRNTYHIEVVASDMGTPSLSGSATVTINILNSNDKAPYFTPTTQRAEVAEDAAVGALVHQLVAVDPDIVSNEALAFAATEPIMAVDKDGNEVVTGEDFKDMFRVERNGRVIVNRKLDRDSYSVIRITVLVTDTTAPVVQQGKGLIILTIIDINEHAPMFVPPWTPQSPKYYFKIREEQPIGTILTTLQATDNDSSISEFKLETPNEFFAIEPLTGVVKIKSRIDYEQIKSVVFGAIVTDTGVPQLSSKADISVEIQNINDNEPTFNTSAPAYNMAIAENTPAGSLVGRVEAHDADLDQYGEIGYEIVGENQDVFRINGQTGEIFVNNATALDRETRQHFVITVVASDKAPVAIRKSTAIPVHINLTDVNDNSPIFAQSHYSATIAENAAINPPAALLQVSATDKDEDNFGLVNYYILDGNKGGFFKLDPNSGILYPSRALDVGNYTLRIEARDDLGSGPHSDTAEIHIRVHSINHYHPVFVMPALTNATVELPFNVVEPEYLVMTVKATDDDPGLDGKVTYHLQVNDKIVQETEEFVIEAASGELRTRKRLNRKETSRYQLVLYVTDQGQPNAFNALTFLTILLVDMNENRPEFPDASNPYKFSVQENGESHQRIGKIQAMIEERDDPIYYYIMLGNDETGAAAFTVDKTTGDIYTAKGLDREDKDAYHLFVLASRKPDLHITDEDRDNYQIEALERDSTVAKVWVSVLDVNDNAPVFERDTYNVGINSKADLNELVTLVNATDLDMGSNGTLEMLIISSNLYKFGSNRSTGSIVPSPFAISKEGRITTAGFMGEYNQDRFVLEVVAKEVESPERFAKAVVNVWIFNADQLIRVILSRPPSEVNAEREEIITELSNATSRRIIVDEIRYHVDSMGRIRMDWCDLYFHAVDERKNEIVPVDEVLKQIDAQYDSLREYYAGYAIENIVPAQVPFVEEEFDIALAAVIALLIILFIGVVTFIVLCCCLKNWVTVSQVPTEIRRKDALIKKQQIIEDLNTTENPLWIEQKLKLYEEQELTMQVFSEPENMNPQSTPPPHNNHNNNNNNNLEIIPPNDLIDEGHLLASRRDSYDPGDNTYATIQPRTISSQISGDLLDDYATLRNNHSATPSMYEFTGSTFQVAQRGGGGADQSDFVTELF